MVERRELGLTPAPRSTTVLLVFLAAGAVLYGRALNAFFVADDFELLASVSASRGPLVLVQPLFTRFLRPTMVLAYDLCYRTFGLVPWPYHAVPLLAHVVNAFLVYLLGRRFLTARDGFLAGLLFLAFSAHSVCLPLTWRGTERHRSR